MKENLLKKCFVIIALTISIQLDAQISGLPGNALKFDGVDDYILGTSGISTELRSITIEAWVYHSILPSSTVQRYVTINPEVAVLRYDGTSGANCLNFYIKQGNGTLYGISVPNVLSTDTWMHIAGTYNGTYLKLYMNGKLIKSAAASVTGLYPPSGTFQFSSSSSSAVFCGYMDEVRIWDYALSAKEIQENMNRKMTGSESHLINYWQFNQNSGTTLPDVKGNADGALKNMATSAWTASTIPFGADTACSKVVSSTGTVSFTGTKLTMKFTAKSGTDTIVSNHIITEPNVSPTGVQTVFDSQYWVINRIGSGTYTANLTFTLNEDIESTQESRPGNIKLYYRGSNSDGAWTLAASATSINAANNTATFNGITNFGQFIVCSDFPQNVPGTALQFDGASNYVNCGNASGLNITGNITIEAWINATAWGANQWSGTIVSKGNTTSGGYVLRCGNNGTLSFVVGTGSWKEVASASIMQSKIWQHVAGVYDGSKLSIYINGKLAGQQSVTGSIASSASSLYIANDPGYSTRYFNGKIDEVTIWNIARTPSQIERDMLTTRSGTENGLVSYWQFNNGSGTSLTDLVGSSNGTLVNMNGTSCWVESYAMVVPEAETGTNINIRSFTANWSPSFIGTVESYMLYVATDSTFSNMVSGYNPKITTGTSYNVTGLTGNTKYYYRLRAEKSSVSGQGDYSDFIQVTTCPALNTPTLSGGSPGVCYNTAPTTFTVTASGGCGNYTYLWYKNSVSTGITTQTYNTGPLTATTTVYCAVSSGGETANSSTYTVNVYPVPVLVITPTNETNYCKDDGTITINPNNISGVTWEFTKDNVSWVSGTDPYTYTALAAGTYSQIYARFTIPSTSTKCTSTAGSTTITQPATLTATVSKTDNTCYGGANGLISISGPSGGTGSGYQASISPDPNSAGWITIPGTFSNLSARGYSVTIRDNNGTGGSSCSRSLGTTTVSGPATAVSVSVSSSSNPLCYGSNEGSVTLNTATGGSGSGYMYSMRNPSGSGTWGSWQSGTTFNGLAAGNYGFKAKDGTGCESTEISRLIINPSALTASKSGINPSCYDGSNGSVTLSGVSGGTSPYMFSNEGNTNYFSGTSPYTFTGLSAGNYSLYVKDANGCTYTPGIQTLSNPADISISSVTPTYVTCYGGSDGTISISTGGGTGSLTYSIGGSYQSSSTFTGLTAGTYNITVKDANSCTRSYASNPVTVPTYTQLTATVNSIISSCYDADDGTITFTGEAGGTGEYNYSIDGGSNWDGSNTFTGLTPGTYNVAIQDLNYESCTRSLGTEVITEPPLANGGTLSGGTTPICYGSGTGTMTVGGYTGSIVKWQKQLGTGGWSDITNTNATYSENPSSAGTWYYRVAVESGTGCGLAYSNNVTIAVDNAVTANAGSDQNLTGTYSATLAGNTPSYGTGTWSMISGNGSASNSPNANTPGAAVTVNAYDIYVFRWTVVNGTCSAYDEVSISFSPNCSAISTFTGTGNWNDYTKWDNGVPASCVNAVINGEVTVNVAGACNKLIVNPAKRVTIPGGQSLTVSDSLKLKSNITGNATLIDLGSLSYPAAKCEVNLTVTGTNALDTLYHFYSAPVNSPNINAFWHFYMYHFDEPAGEWVINHTNDIMNIGKGYAGYNSRNSFGVSFTVKYFGYDLITGTQSFNLDYTPGNPDHFNLVGNPYPSAVDLDQVCFSNVDATVYFWNGTGDYAGQYGTYNISTHASTQGGGNVLPAHNAFFINAQNSSANVTFNNSGRLHTGIPVFKSYNAPANHMRLVVEANDYRDGLTIGLMDEATAGFDYVYDGRKLFSGYEMIPSLYSSTEDGVKVAINELPVQNNTIVPVEFTMGASGNYTIKPEDINTFGSEYSVCLEDLAGNRMVDLKQTASYSFSYTAGESPERFRLHINKSTAGMTGANLNVNVFASNYSVYINSISPLNGFASMYNRIGEKLFTVVLDGKNNYSINMNNFSDGYYLVNVTDDKNSFSRKVYIGR